ncbi:hypothetical protein J6590_090567 [Homalodisca vitripennis]|nr:hypothetical protein J6590_090567 [Homalodisca vitripennis]
MTKSFEGKDPIVIIAGNNDMGIVDEKNNLLNSDLADKIEKHVTSQQNQSYIVVNLFHRHDLPYNCRINKEIKQNNNKLLKLEKEGVCVVDFTRFLQRLFTRHGQHLNGQGKAALCYKLLSAIENLRREQSESSSNAATANQQLTQLNGVPHNNLGKDMPLPVERPEAEPVTLPFDTYADAVKSDSLRWTMASERHQPESSPPAAARDVGSGDPGSVIGDRRMSTESTFFSSKPSFRKKQCTVGRRISTSASPAKTMQQNATNSKFKILHQNSQAATNKINCLNLMADEVMPEVMVITEHHFNECNIHQFRLENYYLSNYFARSNFKGGGIALFVIKGIQYESGCNVNCSEKDLESANFFDRPLQIP